MRRIPLVLAACVLAAAPAAAQAESVVYVGDSLGVGTTPYLRGLLHGVSVRADNRVSRPSRTALGILGGLIRPSDDVVIFDAGTNDDPRATGAYANVLRGVRRVAGSRCVVLATINRPPYGGVGPGGLNAVVERFAATDPAVQVVDWRAYARGGILGPDHIHPTGSGYALRARLMASAVEGCVTAVAAPDLAAPSTSAPRSLPPAAAPSRPRPHPPAKPKRHRLPPLHLGAVLRPYWAPTAHAVGVAAGAMDREVRSMSDRRPFSMLGLALRPPRADRARGHRRARAGSRRAAPRSSHARRAR